LVSVATENEKKTTDLAVQDAAGQSPEVAERPAPTDLGIEIGVEGSNLPFSTHYTPPMGSRGGMRDNLFESIRETYGQDFGPTPQELVSMRRMDGQARALYRLLTLPVKAALASSTFLPAEGGEAEQEFIEQVFRLPPEHGGMSVTFSHFMSQLLMGLFDGFAAFEQVYWMPSFGPLSGKYTLKKLAHRAAETITFVTDGGGSFQGFRQRAFQHGKQVDAFIPVENCFYYAAQEEERKFYGVSFFQSAYYHYDKKVKTYFIAHLAAQRAAVGTRIGTFPTSAGPASKAQFRSALSEVAFAQFMMMPDGYKVEALKEGGSFDFLNYINHHNSQMSKSVLANFFDSDTGGGSNDASLVNFGQPGDEMFTLMLRGVMDDIANSINHYIIPRLIDWNFEGGKYPTFTWSSFTDEQRSIIAETFKTLSTAGQSMTVTPEFMRALEIHMAEEMGLEVDYDAVEEREAEEKAQQEEMLAQQQAAMDAQNAPVGEEEEPVDPTDAFEQQAGFSAESSEGMVKLARDLLDEAQVELSRRVASEEGAKKYGSPIGSLISSDEVAEQGKGGSKSKVTMVRLLSLQAQIDAATELGNEVAAKAAQDSFNEAMASYTGGRNVEYVKEQVRALLGKK
jgi:hypothetical protein